MHRTYTYMEPTCIQDFILKKENSSSIGRFRGGAFFDVMDTGVICRMNGGEVWKNEVLKDRPPLLPKKKK